MVVDIEVIIVGSCNIDLISYVPRLPLPGETLRGNDFSTGFGGKGANQCVAAAKLGASTLIISKVGNDTFGRNFHKNFTELGTEPGIDTSFLKFDQDVATGAATILVDTLGENSIVIVPGANNKLSVKEISETEDVIRRSKIVLCQGEISEETTIKALEVARKHQVTTLMNAAPALASMKDEIFTLADIFCVNETEVHILTGISVTSPDEAIRGAQCLIAKGCTKVIVTLGSNGAVFCSPEEKFHVDSPKVPRVVDTTGAGDAFVGALAYFLTRSEKRQWKELISNACRVASYSVQHKGGQKSFPFLNQVSDLE